ncbi:hypothetical protein SAMN05421676_109113 [Salinibacillus kushneri]|uniref:DUF7147 domain-containing protein n=1 Tax=Salinibacillus kushneri TaxID=237682 RepID=A0A1I0HPI0_9BACI|nr:methylthioribose kinase [Salinibacillus kushneri]SET85910.1 hypothetical protein SAMN05421676_109113 [Salinibacillus kushneri]
MIQRLIPLGNGYSDLYELMNIAKAMPERVEYMLVLHPFDDSNQTSLVLIMKPTNPGKFQPIYICLEGVPVPSKRYDLWKDLAEELHHDLIELTVSPSKKFNEQELYFQHLIGILRTNHYLPRLERSF